MDNKDIINAGAGYVAGNAITNSMIQNLRKYSEEHKEFFANHLTEEQLTESVAKYILANDYDSAFEFLNSHLNNEIVYACSHQKEFIKPLSELIEMRRNKYQPFYAKINREMPKQIKEMTAEQICAIMGVSLVSEQELADYHKNKEEKENAGIIFRAIVIIGIIILCIAAATA